MANFNKKWSELSGDESRAMKEKYGSRSAWQEAKSKAQSHQAGNGSAAQNDKALNNEHTPKANDVGSQSKQQQLKVGTERIQIGISRRKAVFQMK